MPGCPEYMHGTVPAITALFLRILYTALFVVFRENFSGRFCFCSQDFLAGNISTGTILDFPDFEPEIFGPANFRPDFFWIFQLSNRKKVQKISFPESIRIIILQRWQIPIFKRGSFFPTFAPNFFGFFNFQSKNFPAFQLSSRKIFHPGTFRPNFFCRPDFQTGRAGRDQLCGN